MRKKQLAIITLTALLSIAIYVGIGTEASANQVNHPEQILFVRFRIKNSQFTRKVASLKEIDYTIKSINGTIIKTFPNVPGLYTVRLTGSYDMKTALEKLSNFAFVIYCEDISHYQTVPVWQLEYSE